MPAQSIPPAGVSPAVFFLAVNFTVTGQPIAMLADPIDPATGELLSIERGFDPTDAAFINAMRTVRESGSAVESVGQRYADAKLITPQLESFLREETRLALEPLTSTNQIRLVSVAVRTQDTIAKLVVVYFNIARNREQTAVLPLGSLLGKAAA